MAAPFKGSIERLTEKNKFYRKVIHTNPKQQLVLMALQPNQEIGLEAHPHTSQFIRVESGSGTGQMGDRMYHLAECDAMVVPPGTLHNVVAGAQGLKLYTLYSPPEHPADTVERQKPEE